MEVSTGRNYVSNRKKNLDNPWITREIVAEIKQRRKYNKAHRKATDEEDKKKCFDLYMAQKLKVKELVRVACEKYDARKEEMDLAFKKRVARRMRRGGGGPRGGGGGPRGGGRGHDMPHYEEDPNWRPRDNMRGNFRGRFPRSRGGPIPNLGSSFVQDPTNSQMTNNPNIPLSVMGNLQQTFFTQNPNLMLDGPPNRMGGPQSMQSGPPQSMQGGPPQSMQGGPPQSMQGGPPQSMQGGPPQSMQGGPPQSMQGGPPQSMQGGPPQSMQGGPPQSMQGGPPQSMQGGPPQSMQGGPPQSMQGGPPQSMQGGPPQSMQGGPPQSMQGGPPQSMQGGPQNINGNFVNSAKSFLENQQSVLNSATSQAPSTEGAASSVVSSAPTLSVATSEAASVDKDVIIQSIEESTLTPKQKKEAEAKAAWDTLHQYWQFVQDNPYDFDGWTYLLNHVETMDNIEAARAAFDGFLPLYPYCFAYWKKIADMEGSHGNMERRLGVLLESTRCIPVCTDLWLPALQGMADYVKEQKLDNKVMIDTISDCIDSVGLSWRSMEVWDYAIEYYSSRDELQTVVSIYKKLLSTPTKQYNKHWDKFLELVRDNHPQALLPPEEYEEMRKQCCEALAIEYSPQEADVIEIKSKNKTKSTDKVTAAVREKLVASLVPLHESNEKNVNRRWKYEQRIKRPYFHIKSLDRRQLKNWSEYIEFEKKEGDPHRVIVLFERCLVACGQYEEIWCKYAQYMERHVEKVVNGDFKEKNIEESDEPSENVVVPGGDEVAVNSSEKQSSSDNSLNNGVGVVSDAAVRDPKHAESANADVSAKDSSEVISEIPMLSTDQIKSEPVDDVICDSNPNDTLTDNVYSNYYKNVGESRSLWTYGDVRGYVTHGISLVGRVLHCPQLTKEWVYNEVNWEDVRQIYRRAGWIHCASKPMVMMQWAEFEESRGDLPTARQLLASVVAKHPTHLTARLSQVSMERRACAFDKVEELYREALSTVTTPREKSLVSLKYARFLFKVRDNVDTALAVLRKALKKDKTNVYLYQHVFDFCYEKRPMDSRGVLAAVMLALNAKDLPLQEKLWFAKKKLSFLTEHGTLEQTRESRKEVDKHQALLDAHLKELKEKEEAEKKKQEAEEKEKALKENQEKKSSEAGDSKATSSSDQNKANAPQQQQFPSPFIGQDGNIAFNSSMAPSNQGPVLYNMTPPINMEETNLSPEEMELQKQIQNHKNRQYEDMRHGRGPMRALVSQPPPGMMMDLGPRMGGPGFGPQGFNPNMMRNMNPRMFMQHNSPHKRPFPQEFRDGPDGGPDPKHPRMVNNGPGLSLGQGNMAQFDSNYTDQSGPSAPPSHRATFGSYGDGPTPFSRIGGLRDILRRRPNGNPNQHPDMPQGPPHPPINNLPMRPPFAPNMDPGGPRPMGPGTGPIPPRALPIDQSNECVNVPEWLIKEGGELRLSSTPAGNSVIRYWPTYMTIEGSQKMFNVLRKHTKWHQHRMNIDGETVNVPHLLSWVGPCDYDYKGINLTKNDNWRPEIVDLLHRLMQYTEHQYNSCYISLYRNGRDHSPWSAHDHPALREKPVVAIINLGQARSFEMQRKDGRGYLKFPLFSGSLLLLEGAIQEDWVEQIPKNTMISQETMQLTFRTMFMIKGLTV